MNDDFSDEATPVRTSHWRLAVVIAAVLGASSFVLGRLAARTTTVASPRSW